jgi:hypothetical protein
MECWDVSENYYQSAKRTDGYEDYYGEGERGWGLAHFLCICSRYF